jgi:outer membrane protein assembly factor BamB
MNHALRLTRRASLLLPLAALGGCGILDWLGDEAKKPIPGNREPVLAATRGLVIDSPLSVTVPPPISNEVWLQPGGNPAHTGANLAGGLTHAWSRSIGAGGDYRTHMTAIPLIDGERVFTMDTNGTISAFGIAKGEQIWRTPTRPKKNHSGNLGGGIAIDGGKLYAATGRSELMALDLSSGNIVWRQPMPSPARCAPTIVNGMMFLCTIDEKLIAYAQSDGHQIWEHQATQTDIGTLAQASPAYADGLVVAGFESGDLVCARADSGTVVWTDNMGAVKGAVGLSEFASVRAAPALDQGLCYAIGLGGLFAALDLRSGRRVWERDVAGANMPLLVGDFLFVVSSEQKLAALSRDDGSVHWVTDLPRFNNPKRTKGLINWYGPALIGGKLLLVSDHEKLAVLDPEDGKLITSFNLPDACSVVPVAAQGYTFVLTDDATLTAYK